MKIFMIAIACVLLGAGGVYLWHLNKPIAFFTSREAGAGLPAAVDPSGIPVSDDKKDSLGEEVGVAKLETPPLPDLGKSEEGEENQKIGGEESAVTDSEVDEFSVEVLTDSETDSLVP